MACFLSFVRAVRNSRQADVESHEPSVLDRLPVVPKNHLTILSPLVFRASRTTQVRTRYRSLVYLCTVVLLPVRPMYHGTHKHSSIVKGALENSSLTGRQKRKCEREVMDNQGYPTGSMNVYHTSQGCPACGARNKAQDRTYVCIDCGWYGHCDLVGAINISRRTGVSDKRIRATGS